MRIHASRMLIATVILAFLAVPAVAGAASLSLSVSPSAPIIPPGGAVTVAVTASGTADAGENLLFAFWQPTAGACAGTQAAEANTSGVTQVGIQETLPMGPFTVASGYPGIYWTVPRTYRLCGYLYSDTTPQGGQASGPPDASATLVVRVVKAGSGSPHGVPVSGALLTGRFNAVERVLTVHNYPFVPGSAYLFTYRFTRRCKSNHCSLYFAEDGFYPAGRLSEHHGRYSVTYSRHGPKVCANRNPHAYAVSTFVFRPDSAIRHGRARLVSHLSMTFQTHGGGCGGGNGSATWDGTATRAGS